MIKTTPKKVPPIIKQGFKTFKPEMNEAIIMQHTIIKNLLGDKLKDIPLDRLCEIAQEKQEEDTCNYLEDVFSRPDEW